MRSYNEFLFSKTKSRDLESLHNLYIRLLERHKAKYKSYEEILNEITDEFKGQENGNIYYIENNVTYQVHFTFNKRYWGQSWSYSINKINFKNGNKELERDDKINFIMSNKKQFELGDKFRKTLRDDKFYHKIAFEKISEIVDLKLRKLYEKPNFRPSEIPDIIKISISDKKYYVISDKTNYFHVKFKLMECEPNDDVIEIT